MKIILYKDRTIEKEGEVGTQNENNVTDIELVVPSEYEDYNKKIVFTEHEDDRCKKDDSKEKIIAWDFVEDNHYKIRKNISKYESVDCYIWLTKNDKDFRSETTHLTFNRNQEPNDELDDVKIDGFNKMIMILDSKITEVSDLEQDVKDLINDITRRLDSGEFKGEKGDTPQKGVDYFTESEKEEFKSAVVQESKEEIKITVIADSKTELNSYIEDKKTELDNYTTEQEKSLKTELDDYTDTKKTELHTKKVDLETEMSNTKNSLVQEFNTNATDKTTAFNENYNEKVNEFNENSSNLGEKIDSIKGGSINDITEVKVYGESVQAEEPDFLNGKEVPLQVIKDNIEIVLDNGLKTTDSNYKSKSFNLPLQKPLIGNFDFGNDYEKDILDLLNEKEVHHWNCVNLKMNTLKWAIATTQNAYYCFYNLPHMGYKFPQKNNLFQRYTNLNVNNYQLECSSNSKFNIYCSKEHFGTAQDISSNEAKEKWTNLIQNKTLELAYLYDTNYVETLQFTEEQKVIAKEIKDLITYEGYTNISVNHTLNPETILNYNESTQTIKSLHRRVTTLEDDTVNYISELKVEGESKQLEEPDFLENKEVPLQIIKDNITINVSNSTDTKSFVFPLQKPLIGNFNFTDLEKDVLDLLSEKEVHHWNYMNVAASQQNWLTRTIPQINAYTLYIALPYIKNHSKAVSNLFRNGGALETKYVFWIQTRGEFSIVTNPLDFGTLDSMTSEEAIAKWKEMLAGKNLELAYYYMYSEENHYIEELQFTEEQKAIARQIKDLMMYEGYTNVSVNHSLNPTTTLNYVKSNKQAIENINKKLDEVINLLSTSTTSAMLLDSLENDLEKEVL